MELNQAEKFENRKADHIRLSLSSEVQTSHLADFSRIQLIHEALPDLDFSEIDISTKIFGVEVKAPLFISSMTAGHASGEQINLALALAAQERGWMMGVGSQRRELADPIAHTEWKKIRKQAPRAILFGNLGITQLIENPIEPRINQIQKMVDNLEASGLFIHTNPLQECIQGEGTPQFRGALQALEKICKSLSVPVVLKEVGSGFSSATLHRLKNIGLAAVDVAGTGGTHWGRVEELRNLPNQSAGQQELVFGDWGFSTIDSVISAVEANPEYQIWASGGVRSAVDAAKLLAIGAHLVGFAKPFLEASLQQVKINESNVVNLMEKLEKDLKTALLCTGCASLGDFGSRGVWKWKK
jgi:isopentenyl-diphosphate delta-isomerase